MAARIGDRDPEGGGATVKVPGRHEALPVQAGLEESGGELWAKLRLRLSKKPLRAVKRALKKGKQLKAKVKVTASEHGRHRALAERDDQLKA